MAQIFEEPFVTKNLLITKNLSHYRRSRKISTKEGDDTGSPKRGYQWPHKKDVFPPNITSNNQKRCEFCSFS